MATSIKGVEPAQNAALSEIEKKTGRIREMVYLAVSCVNECAYCTAHHTKTAAAAGFSSTEIREIEVENNQHFSPKEQAALHYARELTRTALVREDLRFRVEELFSHDEFVELTMIVGLANFTNRFNNGLAIPLES
jgi:AhpD family alkylhydroperoxidase